MTQQGRRDFVKYSFYKVSPEWRRLPEAQRTQSKTEFAEVLAEFSDRIAMASYSLVGTRGDVDFMLWKISPQLEPIDELMGQLNKTELGKYLAMPHSYLATALRLGARHAQLNGGRLCYDPRRDIEEPLRHHASPSSSRSQR